MTHYDAEIQPDPAEWLALDELSRIELAESYHRAARVKLPNVEAHAAFHAFVETQIAEGLEPVVRAMMRLVRQGLTRHEALHAVGSVLAEQIFEAANSKDEEVGATLEARYNAAVERLTAEDWERRGD